MSFNNVGSVEIAGMLSRFKMENVPTASIAKMIKSPVVVSHNFWGMPTVTTKDGITFHLDVLAAACLWRNQKNNKITQADYVASAYLMKRVHSLYALSDESAKHVGCITKIFLKIRSLLSTIANRFAKGYSIREEISLANDCYIEIPRPLAQAGDFLKRFPPHKYDPQTGDAKYEPKKLAEIFEKQKV